MALQNFGNFVPNYSLGAGDLLVYWDEEEQSESGVNPLKQRQGAHEVSDDEIEQEVPIQAPPKPKQPAEGRVKEKVREQLSEGEGSCFPRSLYRCSRVED